MKKIISILLSLTFIACMLPSAMAAGGKMDNWRIYHYNVASEDMEGARVELDDSEAYMGTHSVKFTYDLPLKANRYMYIQQQVSGLEAGHTYKYGAAVKAKNANSGILWLGWSAQRSLTPLGINSDWNTYTYTWTADVSSIALKILVENSVEALWIDEVWFREVYEDGTLGPDLIRNGAFDSGSGSGRNNNANAAEINSLETVYNNILNSDTFSATDMRRVVGGFNYAPVYKAENIKIDGDLSDWEGYPEIALPTKSTQIYSYDTAHSIDGKAWCRYAYDSEYFYLGIKVEDDIVKVNNNPNTYWMGDSIQIALCDEGKVYEEEIGWSYNADGKPTMGSTVYGTDQLDSMKLEAKLTNDGFIYEFAFPWKLKYKDGVLPKGFLFDIIVNDNDKDETQNRQYVLELAPGMADAKNSEKFPYLEFRDSKSDWYGWVDGPEELISGNEGSFSYYLVNDGAEKEVTISIPSINKSETVVIPEKTGIRRNYKASWPEKGNYSFEVIATDGEMEHKSSSDIKIKAPKTNYEKMVTDLQTWADNLKLLIDECESKGITPDYEKISWRVLERYAYPYVHDDTPTRNPTRYQGYLQQDIEAGNDERVEWNYEMLEGIYNNAANKLKAYLDGSEKPLPVTRFVQSPIRLDGKMVYTKTDTEGVIEERPFFFTGFGHFGSAGAEVPNWQDFGHNIIQQSLEPASYIVYSGSDKEPFQCQKNVYTEQIHKYLKSAEENDVKVDLLLGLHVIPEWMKTKWTDLYGSAIEGAVVQHKHILIHEMFKKLIDVHVKFVMEEYGDYKSLNSICLSNEPTTNTNSSFYQPYWALYLIEVYDNDIEKLNKVYGTNYEKFLDVPMHSVPDFTIQFYDWKTFNDDILTESNAYVAEQVKKYKPDMPVHAKMMTMGRSSDWDVTSLGYGTQHELFGAFSDINGNDASAYVHSQHFAINEMEFFQDIQMGVNKAPCFNSEDHMMMDQNDELTYAHGDHCYTKLWQSFIHGNGFSTIWQWHFITDPNVISYGLPPSDPYALIKIGQAGFDANRLAYEIGALLEKEPKIGVVQSYKSRIWSNHALNATFRVWWAGLQTGAKTELIPEDQISRIHDYDVLIIPNSTHVSADTVNEIKKYADSGKKILFLGEESLKKDWRDNAHDEQTIEYIRSKSQFVNTKGSGPYITSHTNSEYVDIMLGLLEEMNMNEIEVIDQDTGKPLEDIEIMYADYNGATIINFMSMDESKVRKFKIYKNGIEQKNLYELISDKQLPSSTVELDVYKPLLIRLDDNSQAPKEENVSKINIVIDGKEYQFTEASPFVDERDRTLVPIRFVSEALGALVNWDAETRTVNIDNDEDKISYTIGAFEGIKNGEVVEFDTCGVIKDDRTFVPVRYISTMLNCEVGWDADTKTVIIKSESDASASAEETTEENKTDVEESEETL